MLEHDVGHSDRSEETAELRCPWPKRDIADQAEPPPSLSPPFPWCGGKVPQTLAKTCSDFEIRQMTFHEQVAQIGRLRGGTCNESVCMLGACQDRPAPRESCGLSAAAGGLAVVARHS